MIEIETDVMYMHMPLDIINVGKTVEKLLDKMGLKANEIKYESDGYVYIVTCLDVHN